jgi:D-alanyl-D-alanine carboxypeptidase (penicillin-binding protein 5/6)
VLSFEAIVDAVLLSSGNDATYSLAVNLARSHAGQFLSDTDALSYFADLMNRTAANLGCTDSHFVSVDGYPSPDHYSTAYDLLRISVAAANTPLIAQSVTKSRTYHVFHSGRDVVRETTNMLLKKDSEYRYAYATGMKTGSTGEKYSLAASAEKNGTEQIAIVLDAGSNAGRFQDAIHLLEQGFNKEL